MSKPISLRDALFMALPASSSYNDWYHERILDKLPAGAYACDAEGLITYYNAAARKLWGRAPKLNHPDDRFCGSFKLFLPDGQPIKHDQCWMARALKENAPFNEQEIIIERPDGTRVWGMAHANPVHDAAGRLIGAVNILLDITERKHAEIAKSEFLAHFSHEIRTPMNAVVGLANLLELNAGNPARQKEFISTLKLSAQQLMDLINNLLDAAKLEAQQLQLERTPFTLHDIISEVVSINAVKAKEKAIELKVEQHCNLNLPLLGDPLRVRQVLMNMIGNAVKFTAKGSVTLRIYCDMNEKGDTARIRIDVADTGCGIEQSMLDGIFAKFSQADQSVARNFGGTGLGLSISKSLVDLMGGNITVSSDLGKGSTFSIWMPFALSGTRPEPEIKPDTLSASAQPAAEKSARILVVEDYSANILVVTSMLSSFGYAYDVAQTGREAVDRLANEKFDIVLMDVQMPEMDGYQATGLIRARERQNGQPGIPIIGMTAHALQGDKEKCFEAGMDDYISKPFQPNELQEKIAHYTGDAQLKQHAVRH